MIKDHNEIGSINLVIEEALSQGFISERLKPIVESTLNAKRHVCQDGIRMYERDLEEARKALQEADDLLQKIKILEVRK